MGLGTGVAGSAGCRVIAPICIDGGGHGRGSLTHSGHLPLRPPSQKMGYMATPRQNAAPSVFEIFGLLGGRRQQSRVETHAGLP